MIITTTDQVPGRQISEVLGMARGSWMKGATTILSSFSDSHHINRMLTEVDEVENEAIRRLTEKAEILGADAIIGTRLQATALEDAQNLKYVVTVYGTAVKLG